ncbi:GreA/GreB family elongation factor [Nocardioides dongkuii]|uniref:GreA/GreB family elongation factor n=1 Tax=Nocardioides dongkuii TaxID=2760089 RepID=UPI0018777E8E|nr:GreA/GreB family elongation factor [Nocardioides dongkuii]
MSLNPADLLAERLEALRAERAEVLAESRLGATGDVADRATNVEATIRLQVLDERMTALEDEIEQARHHRHTDGVVSVGDVVTLDLGDGPETYLVGSVEQAVAGVDTVTPSSPLGKAIVGADVGATVSYSPRTGVKLSATVVSAGAATSVS